MGKICQASVFHSPGISPKLFSKKREKNGRNPRFPACHCFSSRRKTTGWFWIPILLLTIDTTGAESAKHLHNLVRQHLRLPVRLQRGNPLPVHLLRFTNTLVRHSS